MTSIQIRNYPLHLVTPAFLGNAEQLAQWRTPPIKALLRQWWRVNWMSRHQYPDNIAAMRQEEAHIFGHAWLQTDKHSDNPSRNNSRKSAVQLRLQPVIASASLSSGWSLGSQQGLGTLPKTLETSYAWFGLDTRRALRAEGQEAQRILSVAAPATLWPELEIAFKLITTMGSLGSGSRRGWGSLHISSLKLEDDLFHRHSRPLEDCLARDWGAALAADVDGPWAWLSKKTYKEWPDAVAEIARTRRQLRTSFPSGQRAALGFAAGGRMPSPLRWKVIPVADGSLQIVVFAMPHQIPSAAKKTLSPSQLSAIWKGVFESLQTHPNYARFTS